MKKESKKSTTALYKSFRLLTAQKEIDPQVMLDTIKNSMVSAYSKSINVPNNSIADNITIEINDEKEEIRIYRTFEIVETVEDPIKQISLEEAKLKSKKYKLGDIYKLEVNPKNFSRISAQAAKGVIVQKLRESERAIANKELWEKKGQVISAKISKVDLSTGDILIELLKKELTIYKRDLIDGEVLRVGDYIDIYIAENTKNSQSNTVTLSRTHEGLVKYLFEREIPEIQDGTVVINAIAREAGSRTKIAVSSNNPDVDPIGACIGTKGMRKNNITAKLGNEKIDIIKYNEDPATFISAALAPATVLSVVKIPADNKNAVKNPADDKDTYRVIVDDDQLSLAIGRKGQNARLAAKLTGNKIDIKSTTTLEAKLEAEELEADDIIETNEAVSEASEVTEATE